MCSAKCHQANARSLFYYILHLVQFLVDITCYVVSPVLPSPGLECGLHSRRDASRQKASKDGKGFERMGPLLRVWEGQSLSFWKEVLEAFKVSST